MSAKPLHQQIEDLKKAIEGLASMRSVLGDAIADTTLTVLQDQLSELERQATQQEAANTARRKQVTVLFADVSGFTALSEHMDAEDVANLVNHLWIRADRVIQEFGGHIDKHIGDEVMALWGTETAREDDAERAVRAAIKMEETFKEGSGSLPIRLKVGINSRAGVIERGRYAGRVHCDRRYRQYGEPPGELRQRRRYPHHPRHLSTGARCLRCAEANADHRERENGTFTNLPRPA